MHRVVIIGGGFAGLNAALGLRRAPVEVTVLDRRNVHVFQPLLYQVATGGLSPGDITSPIRHVLKDQANAHVLLGDATGIDLDARHVQTDGDAIPYDTLIVATGAGHHYFGQPQWERSAPGLKTVEDAIEMRQRMFAAFEEAERLARRGQSIASLLTFVIVGAGPTGVELAGALGELSRDTLRRDFRSIDTSAARIVLVEGTSRVLPGYPDSLSLRALRSLERLGVTVRLDTRVSEVTDEAVALTHDGVTETLETRCVLWAAGVRASHLGKDLAGEKDEGTDSAGRVKVLPDLTVPGHPEIFVIGDLAHVEGKQDTPVPGVAPAAIQQGKYVAKILRRRLAGKSTAPFVYKDKGSLATIGRKSAVADFGRLRFSGLVAWMLWLGVHLMFLVGFENRILVFTKWGFCYVTRNRGARLILGHSIDERSRH
ncbi:MAG: NAD(P)/FAD-dependent oxidoreductase [Acidobacteriota bacterium]|nr:NAD(P)/FAD-dependent oxidoreductase [Acidobacteriota bacterium]MDH3784807.1 NAD(P)/FAD-dependent oxidoreductase [Acidobacteriota bacterium]